MANTSWGGRDTKQRTDGSRTRNYRRYGHGEWSAIGSANIIEALVDEELNAA